VSIEEIIEALRAIIAGAEGRDLTDEEAQRYEDLEGKLAVAKRTAEIRSRQTAYDTPVQNRALEAVVHTGTAKQDDTLNRAFESYLRTGKVNQDLMELRAQEAGTTTEGGFLVSPEFRQKLVEVRQAFGGLANEVETITTSTGAALEYPSLDDTSNSGAIDDEEAQITDGDDLAFGQVTLGAFKYTATGGDGAGTGLRVSWELLQDSEFDIQALVARALGTRIMRKQAVDWTTGTGTSLPFGIAESGLTPDRELATHDTIAYVDLSALEGALDPEYEQNAKWVMNKASWVAVRDLEDDDGRPLVWNAQDSLTGRVTRSILGYPVVIDQSMPDHDATSGHFAVLGDLREAYVIRRVAPFVLVVDPYTRAGNGQVQYFGWERADGAVQNRSAYVLAGNTAS
jgi:HK97 family phage major capsid protein